MVQCSTMLLIHQDPFLVEETLPEIAKFFADAVLWDGKEIADLKEKIAKFRYLFAHTTPFSRGSASIAEWFEQILYQFHGFEVDYNNEVMIDLEAFSSPLWSDFIAKYPEMIRIVKESPS